MKISDSDAHGIHEPAGSPATAPNAPERDAHGRFLPGHGLSRDSQFTAGNFAAAGALQRTDRLPAVLAHVRDEIRQFMDAALADEGGDTEVPVRRRALLEYRGRLHGRIVQLDDVLELRGLVDGRGRLRATWLAQLAGLVERARQVDATLGLERRTKPVASARDIIATYNRERQ